MGETVKVSRALPNFAQTVIISSDEGGVVEVDEDEDEDDVDVDTSRGGEAKEDISRLLCSDAESLRNWRGCACVARS